MSGRNSNRLSAACQRCRKRKTRCDLESPRCGACVRAATECVPPKPIGSDTSSHGYVMGLEARLSELEAQLLRRQQGRPLPSDTPDGGDNIGPGSSDLGVTLDGVEIGLPEEVSNEWLAFDLRSTTQFALGCSQEQREPLIDRLLPTSPITLDSAPVSAYLGAYISRVHEGLPFLRTEQLAYMRESIATATTCPDNPILCLVLAIGGVISGPKTLSRSFGIYHFAHRARVNVSRMLGAYSLDSLQLLLLLTIFSFLDPYGGNTWHLSGLALNVAITLGLHKEDNLQKQGGNTGVCRIAFWSCYVIDRCVALATHRPFGIADGDITTTVPHAGGADNQSILASLCHLAQVASQRQGDSLCELMSSFEPRPKLLQRLDDTKASFSFSVLCSYHFYTWCLKPPFSSTEYSGLPGTFDHGHHYVDLLNAYIIDGWPLPWIVGSSVFHAATLSHFASLLAPLQVDGCGQQASKEPLPTATNILTNIAARFPSIESLVSVSRTLDLRQGTEASSVGTPDTTGVQNPSTRQLIYAIQGLNGLRDPSI